MALRIRLPALARVIHERESPVRPNGAVARKIRERSGGGPCRPGEHPVSEPAKRAEARGLRLTQPQRRSDVLVASSRELSGIVLLVPAIFALEPARGPFQEPSEGAESRVQVRELRLRPQERDRMVLSFEIDVRTEPVGEAWCPIRGGVRMTDEATESDGGQASTLRLRGRLVDDLVRVVDGEVHRLERRFEELRGNHDLHDETGVVSRRELTSPLYDRGVRFTRAKGGTFDVAFTEGLLESDDPERLAWDRALLADLSIDTFGHWFLPEEPVVPGATWQLSPDAWSDFVQFGGEHWIGDHAAAPPTLATAGLQREKIQQARDNADGRVLCRLDEVRRAGERPVAVISIDVEIDTGSEIEYQVAMVPDPLLVAESVEDRTTAKGTCLWDVAAGRPISIEFDVRVEDTSTRVETILFEGNADSDEWSTSSVSTGRMALLFQLRELLEPPPAKSGF